MSGLDADSRGGSDEIPDLVLGGAIRLRRAMGQGGTARILLGERCATGGDVVVKVVRRDRENEPELEERLEREARALARLAHVHTVTLIASGTACRHRYLVLQRIGGMALSRAIAAGPLEPPRAVAIVRQVLDALDHAHRRGVVHGDIKADNVILSQTGDGADFATLIDFGAARFDDDEPDTRGIVLATPSVMAPEQIRLEASDGRADVYAAGVLLYELLVGRKPFRHAETRELLRMHLFRAPTPPRRAAGRGAASAALERVVLRALAKRPEERYASAAMMGAALAETPEARSRRRPRGVRLLAFALAGALVAAAALAPDPGAERPAPESERPTPAALAPLAPVSGAGSPASACGHLTKSSTTSTRVCWSAATWNPAVGSVSASPDPRSPVARASR